MTTMTTTTRYTRVAIALHWLIALAIFANLALGFYMADLDVSPQKLRLYSYHKWLGVTVFLLVLVRVAWRLTHRPPALPGTMRWWERTAAGVTHTLLYVLTLSVPLTGWLHSSTKGFKTVYLGLLPIPDLLGKDAVLAPTLRDWHENLNLIMLALVILHVGAALKHMLVGHDDVFGRMVPGIKPPKVKP